MKKRKIVFTVIFLSLLINDGCTNQRITVDFPRIDANKTFQYLLEQVDIGYRYIGTDAHIQCGDYIISNVEKFADRVDVQNFTVIFRGKNVNCRNIIAFFRGNMNSKTFLIGAHYDTRPIADRDKDPSKRDQPILGASDGASGVAILISMAETLSKVKPDRNILLVFFDAEDSGGIDGLNYCIGSEHFAKNRSEYNIDFGIILDLVGDSDLLMYKEGYSMNSSPELVKEVWKHAMIEGHRNYFSQQEKYQIFDDHVPLIMSGIPSIDLIDFDYTHWHTTHDTPENCSPNSLYVVGNSVLNFIYNSSFATN